MKNIRKELWIPWWEAYYNHIEVNQNTSFEDVVFKLTWGGIDISHIKYDILTIIENE